VYEAQLYWWGAPFKAAPYFGFSQRGDMNHRYGLQPGLDLNGNEYPWENGKPVRKFQKYPDDVRLKKYRNLGNSTREGMFIYGYLDYVDANGETRYVTSDDYTYRLYLRDQVGVFKDTPPEEYYPNPSSGEPTPQSDMYYGDQNSGWCLVKYPHYTDNDHYQESDFVILRLPEIYYSLAECKFRAGDAATASKLLNAVRARYYPEGSASLYNEDGSELSEQELLDEWGREFIGEGMRRTTLCRFGVYSSAKWWDKEPDSGDYTMILPFSSRAMQANTNLKQNPGWPDIDR
jgi:hypothetical protein